MLTSRRTFLKGFLAVAGLAAVGGEFCLLSDKPKFWLGNKPEDLIVPINELVTPKDVAAYSAALKKLQEGWPGWRDMPQGLEGAGYAINQLLAEARAEKLIGQYSVERAMLDANKPTFFNEKVTVSQSWGPGWTAYKVTPKIRVNRTKAKFNW